MSDKKAMMKAAMKILTVLEEFTPKEKVTIMNFVVADDVQEPSYVPAYDPSVDAIDND